MPDFATTPLTFTAARDFLAQKVNLPTELGSLDLSLKVPARIRAQSFFSAKVASANIVQALRTEVEAIARGDYNYARGRVRLKDFLRTQGYGVPDVGAKGERNIKDLASTRRLDLILRQNVAMAHAVGQREVAELPAVMEDMPCYEYLPSGAEHPRSEHMQFYGLILPKTDPFWRTHYPPWEFGCDCGIGQTDAPPNGKSSGFKPHAPMDGHLDYNGRMTQLTGNASGFEFDSTPATVFGQPDFSTIEDPALRSQVTAAFNKKFSPFGLAVLNKDTQPPGHHVVFGSATHPITVEQRQAIHDWTSPEFEPMRQALLDEAAGKAPDAEAYKKIKLFRQALQKIPPTPGTTHRGLSFASEQQRQAVLAACIPGQLLEWPMFSSSSQDAQVAERYAAKTPFGIMFEIHGLTGRDIHLYAKKKHELEVLFLEGCRFRVDKVDGQRIVFSEVTGHA